MLPKLLPCVKVKDPQYDGVVIVTDSPSKLVGDLEPLKDVIEKYGEIDEVYTKEVIFIKTDVIPSKRLIFSPTGPLNRDYDDVRRFADAAVKGMQRALKAGCKKPLFVRPVDDNFVGFAGKVATLGALHALYVPLEIREDVPEKKSKADLMGIWCNDEVKVTKSIPVTTAIESGRVVARDIGGSDPERMAAPRVLQYVQETLKDSGIKINVISDKNEFKKSFPLLEAVNRCASHVDRHTGRLIFLEYEGEGPIDTTLFLVGKGITYDTGGADIKAGGVMAGMHRDKCGAAAVAGFFKIYPIEIVKLSILKSEPRLSLFKKNCQYFDTTHLFEKEQILNSNKIIYLRVWKYDDTENDFVSRHLTLNRVRERQILAVKSDMLQQCTKGRVLLRDNDFYTVIFKSGHNCYMETRRNIISITAKQLFVFRHTQKRARGFELNIDSNSEIVFSCINARTRLETPFFNLSRTITPERNNILKFGKLCCHSRLQYVSSQM
ncbi:leucyl aminopeptidase, partial [Mytilus galloprovincialis]